MTLRDIVEQQLQQLHLDLLDDIHHALDHLTGKVLEILRHHDLEQFAVGGAGLIRHHGQIGTRVDHQFTRLIQGHRLGKPGVPAPAERLRLTGQGILQRLGPLTGIEGTICRLLRLAGHIIEAITSIGDRLGSTFDLPIQPQLTHVVAQHARQLADTPNQVFAAIPRSGEVGCPIARHHTRISARG